MSLNRILSYEARLVIALYAVFFCSCVSSEVSINCFSCSISVLKTSFFKTGPNKIELLEATNSDSPIAKFIQKKGEGIHHIAFLVQDIFAEIARLRSEGFIVLNEIPKKGADNKLVVFLHPKTTNGVLIELCQETQ